MQDTEHIIIISIERNTKQEVKVAIPQCKDTLLQVKVLYQSLIYVNVQKN